MVKLFDVKVEAIISGSVPVMRMLRDASSLFGLTDPAAWNTDFAVGYVLRYTLWGATETYAVQNKQIKDLDAVTRKAIAALARMGPTYVPLNVEGLEERLNALMDTIPADRPLPESAFWQGLISADRVLHGALGQQFLDDDIGLQVKAIFDDYRRLPGRRPRHVHFWFRSYKWSHAYALARTLGERAFGLKIDRVSAARLLGFRQEGDTSQTRLPRFT